MEEFGVVGDAQLMQIDRCPQIEMGAGRICTGWFEHSAGQLWELSIEGSSTPIRGTDRHPIWSNDRLAWVPLSELQESESVQVQGGYAKDQRLQETEDVEKVYTLEIDADHCYRVGEQGLLVHNASWRLQEVASVTPVGLAYGRRAAQYRQQTSISDKANLGYLRYRDLTANPPVSFFLGQPPSRALYSGSIASTIATLNPVVGHGNPPTHGEQQLLAHLATLSTNPTCDFLILDIFTERTPCSYGLAGGCQSFLTATLQPYNLTVNPPVDVTVYFVVQLMATTALTAQALVARYNEPIFAP